MAHQLRMRGRAARSTFATALVLGLVASFTVSCGTGEALPEVSGYPEPGETPQRGGEVAYGLEAETSDLCLAQATLAISGIQEAMAVYDTLTRPAVDDEGNLTYAPYLAESVERNADATVWTIKVREGVKFHDGSELDAQTVKDNIDTYRGQGTNENIAALLFQFVLSDLTGVFVTDKYTVEITMDRPWVAFPAYLYSSGRLGIMAQSQLQNRQCNLTPVGTGPFRLESVFDNGWVPEGGCASTEPGQFRRPPADPAQPGARTVPPPDCQGELETHGQPPDWSPFEEFRVQRFEDYWYIAPDGKPYPYLDAISFRPTAEPTQRRYALQSDDLQLAHFSGADDLKALQDFREAGQVNFIDTNEFTEVTFVQINNSRPPFNDKRFRNALQYGINRRDINTIINQGTATIADSPFAPGTPAHEKETGYPEPDKERARELVEEYLASPEGEAAFPDGNIEIVLSLTPSPGVIQLGQLLQAEAEQFGVTITLDPIEQVALIQRAISGQFDIMTFRNWPGGDPDTNFVWWYCNGTPSPDLIERIQEQGFPEPPGQPPYVDLNAYTPPSGANPVNFARYCDPRVDAILDQGRSELDPERRIEMYKGINTVFADEGWWQLGWYTRWAVGFQPEVNDIYGPPMPGPDGEPLEGINPWPALVVGHQVTGIWLED